MFDRGCCLFALKFGLLEKRMGLTVVPKHNPHVKRKRGQHKMARRKHKWPPDVNKLFVRQCKRQKKICYSINVRLSLAVKLVTVSNPLNDYFLVEKHSLWRCKIAIKQKNTIFSILVLFPFLTPFTQWCLNRGMCS